MKITNMNDWLLKIFYASYLNGEHLGNYSTESEAIEVYEKAKALKGQTESGVYKRD